MADNYMRFSEATEATDAQMTDAGLMAVSVVDQSSASGYSTKRTPLSRLGNYILNKYAALQLGGVARTVKAAIDAITSLLGSSNMGTTATTVTAAIAEHEDEISALNNSLSVQDISNQITIVETSYVEEAKLYCFAGHVYYLMVRINGNMPTGSWVVLTRWNNSVGTLDSMPATASHGNGSNVAKNIYALVSPTELDVQLSQSMSSASDYARISAVWFH